MKGALISHWTSSARVRYIRHILLNPEMIHHTFQILDRVGEGKERSLWSQGISSWDSFLGAPQIRGFPRNKKAYFDRSLLGGKGVLHVGE